MSDLLNRIDRYLHDDRYLSTTELVEDCKTEIERLQTVLDLAHEKCVLFWALSDKAGNEAGRLVAREIINILDGEVKP